MFPAFAHFRRTATRDTELNGQQIREGDKVVMWYVSSNRDESRYEDPDRFDVTRNPEHQAFGAGGRHFCLGTALARLELRILLEETLARYPEMELAGDAAVRRVAVRQPAQDAAGAARVSARHGVFVAPFDELSEPRVVAELAPRAEARGWDGFFVWDHVAYREPVRALADPWVTLAAVAVATERLIIGPLVTPLARRRPHQLARETVTLDRLSGGRLVLGVGLGQRAHRRVRPRALRRGGRPRARARLLDDGLERAPGLLGRRVRAARRPAAAHPGLGRRRAGRTGGRCAAPRARTGSSRSTCPAPRRSPSCRRGRGAARPAGAQTPFELVVTNPAGHRP